MKKQSTKAKRNPNKFVPSTFQLKLILVPMDFSSVSMKALHYGVGFAKKFGAKIVLLNIVEPALYPVDESLGPFVPPIERLMKLSKDKLDSIVRQSKCPQLFSKTVVSNGQPFMEITKTARKLKVDLIVITTHGYTGFKHVFLGSTAERVVRHASCPVLTVREKEHEFIR
jgi:universal stress protein A